MLGSPNYCGIGKVWSVCVAYMILKIDNIHISNRIIALVFNENIYGSINKTPNKITMNVQ